MEIHYEKVIKSNLLRFFAGVPDDMEGILGAERDGDRLFFRAFGEDCSVGPDTITLSGKPDVGPRAIVISLYLTHAGPGPICLEPFISFKDLPGTMPYQGAFGINSEKVLVPHVVTIRQRQKAIKEAFTGQDAPPGTGGDFSFLLYPLPKVALCYIFYLPDEEFPASATCLFSANAASFLPLDGLADAAEYTSRGIMRLLKVSGS